MKEIKIKTIIIGDSFCGKTTILNKYVNKNFNDTFMATIGVDYYKSMIIKGDDTYTSIAAASILAKVSRDKHIEEICDKYPILDEYYNISKNKGYGAKVHIDGIKKYGITKFHRKSFGICKISKCIQL